MQDSFIVSLFKYGQVTEDLSTEGSGGRADVSAESETEQKESLGVLKSPLPSSETHGQEADGSRSSALVPRGTNAAPRRGARAEPVACVGLRSREMGCVDTQHVSGNCLRLE